MFHLGGAQVHARAREPVNTKLNNERVKLTTRPRPHILEGLSIARVNDIMIRAGWVVERLHEDYGEDLYVRIFVEGKATPLAFFVQLKATDHLERYLCQENTVSFPIGRRHLDQWTGFWEPVILIVYDAKTGNCYWESVTRFLESKEGMYRFSGSNKNIKIDVPCFNLLNEAGLVRISNHVKHRFRRLSSERAGANLLIRLLEEKGGVKIKEYNATSEILIIESAAGGCVLYPFGRLEEFTYLAETKGGLSVENALLKAMHEKKPSFPFDVRDSNGLLLMTINNDKEYCYYMQRHDDFHDIDDAIFRWNSPEGLALPRDKSEY